MRYEIQFELEQEKIILDYRRKFLSWFKSILGSYNTEIKDKFYETNKSKGFTFSIYLPVEKIEKEYIYLKSNKIKMFLSIAEMEDSLHFMNAILGAMHKKYPFGDNNSLKAQNLRPVREKEINENSVIFKTLSPLVIREKENQWYHDFDEKGIEILKQNIIATLEEKFPKKYLEELNFIPFETKKIIVKFYSIRFPVTSGIFKVEGRKEILNYLYKTGVGSRSSAGFGMCEVLQ